MDGEIYRWGDAGRLYQMLRFWQIKAGQREAGDTTLGRLPVHLAPRVSPRCWRWWSRFLIGSFADSCRPASIPGLHHVPPLTIRASLSFGAIVTPSTDIPAAFLTLQI